jgi:molybdopterin molybdotransferase
MQTRRDASGHIVIALDQAQLFVRESLVALAPVEVSLDHALGCVAAEVIVAPVPVPGFSSSAMDGYALRATDTTDAPVLLRIVGALRAGDVATSRIDANEAIRIMTGAPLPNGADCVCMIEDVEVEHDGTFVQIPRTIEIDHHVRHLGDDVAVGQVLIEPGDELLAAHLGVLATQGLTSVLAHPRPRVGVLSTGNELARDFGPLEAGKIHDSNRPTLIALLRWSGFTPVDLGTSGDDIVHIADTFRQAVQSCDAVISTGGVSVGDVDYVKTVITDLCGANGRSMQVAIKPGKPFAFGIAPEQTPIFGLAGNPVSMMVGFEMFVRPALRLLAGHRTPDRPRVLAVLDCPISRRRDGKVHLVHAVARFHDDGRLHVEQNLQQAPHSMSAIVGANALIIVPDGDGLTAGEEVPVLLFDTH